VPTTPARPGMIVADSAFAVLACNAEALRILFYPDRPDNSNQSDTWLSGKVRSALVEQAMPLKIVEQFRSARRTYLCRSFTLEVKKPLNNGASHNGGLHVVLLERRMNHTMRLSELSQRFGLGGKSSRRLDQQRDRSTHEYQSQHRQSIPSANHGENERVHTFRNHRTHYWGLLTLTLSLLSSG
jgi:hypothetical protein